MYVICTDTLYDSAMSVLQFKASYQLEMAILFIQAHWGGPSGREALPEASIAC